MRHFVPLVFVLSIAGLSLSGFASGIFWWLLAVELGVYLSFGIFFSFRLADTVQEFFMILLLFPIFHVSYGIGSLKGIIKLFSKNYRNKSYIVKKI